MTKKKKHQRINKPGQLIIGYTCNEALRPHSDLTGATIKDSKFCDTVLSGSRFDRAIIENCDFDGAAMTNSSFDFMTMRDTRFTGSSPNSTLKSATLERCELQNASLEGCVAISATFDACKMEHVYSPYADFSEATFKHCEMNDIRGRGVTFDGALIEDSVMTGVDLEYARMRNVRFVNSNLSRADISRSILDGSDLSGAFARESTFSNSRFENAVLRGADLTGSDLKGSRFTNADLTGANLSRADITAADLSLARLDGVTFNRAAYDETTRWPDGFKVPDEAINESEMSEACESMREALENRVGRVPSPVFINSPDPNNLFDLVYSLYPEFYTVVGNFAFAESLAVRVVTVIEHAMGALRVGDGVSPFETEMDKMLCLLSNFYSATTPAQIAAGAELHGTRIGELNYDVKRSAHSKHLYKLLCDQLVVARKQATRTKLIGIAQAQQSAV
jgi:uncharacterized protein YjbI with pentapeptide repeats